jgi:hypothetical protein
MDNTKTSSDTLEDVVRVIVKFNKMSKYLSLSRSKTSISQLNLLIKNKIQYGYGANNTLQEVKVTDQEKELFVAKERDLVSMGHSLAIVVDGHLLTTDHDVRNVLQQHSNNKSLVVITAFPLAEHVSISSTNTPASTSTTPTPTQSNFTEIACPLIITDPIAEHMFINVWDQPDDNLLETFDVHHLRSNDIDTRNAILKHWRRHGFAVLTLDNDQLQTLNELATVSRAFFSLPQSDKEACTFGVERCILLLCWNDDYPRYRLP